MVAPVKQKPDVYSFVQDSRGHYVDFHQATKYVQRRPFNLVLPLDARHGWSRNNSPYIGIPLASRYDARFTPTELYDPAVRQRLNNVAFDRLRAKAYDKVQAGLNALELRQSIELIANTSRTLLELGKAIRRRDSRAINKWLRRKSDHPVDYAKSFADLWLSFHFGWSPLLGDIHDALETFVNPKPIFVRVSAKAMDQGGSTEHHDDGPSSYTLHEERNWVARVRCGVLIKSVKDPLAFTLEQYGLNNPAALAWESVPYSFVVDWIADVGLVLEAATAFFGLELEGAFSTFSLESNMVKSSVRNSGLLQSSDPNFFSDVFTSGGGKYIIRSAGLPAVDFALKSFKPPSKERALTALSLLTQFLKRS